MSAARDGKTWAVFVGVVASAVGLFVVDYLTPLGVAVWFLYVGVVLISLWFSYRWQTYTTALACTILMVAGLFTSPESYWLSWTAQVNRLMGVLAVWTVAVAGLAARRTYQLQEANEKLQREIAVRERLQAQLLRTQRLESIGVLASGIAHDFNNLLTPILMAVKLLKEDRTESERLRLLETLQASGERAAETVRQLLSFAGGTDGRRVAVSLERIVKEVVSILEHTFPKVIQIETVIDAQLQPVSADPTQLSQVLMNLCVNARDAMPQGGNLSISATNVVLSHDSLRLYGGDGVDIERDPRSYSHVLVQVDDTGCGIPADVIHQVFDPFFTTKEAGKGTGLGLSTAMGIVKSHGGFMDVSSEAGKGSRFAVYLPVQRNSSEEEPEPSATETRTGQGEVILVVDDERFIRDTVQAALEAHGYRVLTAANGKEGLSLYERQQSAIRAVILDVTMPEMDGVSALEAMRVLDPDVRIIACSGLRARGRLAEHVAAGRTRFLLKPFGNEQLLAALDAVLREDSSAVELLLEAERS